MVLKTKANQMKTKKSKPKVKGNQHQAIIAEGLILQPVFRPNPHSPHWGLCPSRPYAFLLLAPGNSAFPLPTWEGKNHSTESTSFGYIRVESLNFSLISGWEQQSQTPFSEPSLLWRWEMPFPLSPPWLLQGTGSGWVLREGVLPSYLFSVCCCTN